MTVQNKIYYPKNQKLTNIDNTNLELRQQFGSVQTLQIL